MLPSKFKENRASCIEVLFDMFKALPSRYHAQKEEVLDNNSIKLKTVQLQTIRQVLDKKATGFDYVEISSVYLSGFDQKVFRAILQAIYKQDEKPLNISEENIQAEGLNKEYISTKRNLYSNSVDIDINYFYKLINPHSKSRSSSNIYEKLYNSLNRLSKVNLCYSCKDRSKIVSAPLVIFMKEESELFLQVHPLINAFKYESSNNESLIKVKQSYYLIDNVEYFKLQSSLQQLLYSKIQYKFASMNPTYKEITLNFNTLKSQIFLQTKLKKTNYNQKTKLKQAITQLNNTCSYTLKLEGTSKTLQLIINRD